MFSIDKIYYIWDKLLTEPPSFLYVLGIAVLKQVRKRVLESSSNGIIEVLSGLSGLLNIKQCLEDADQLWNKIPLSVSLLKNKEELLNAETLITFLEPKDLLAFKESYLVVDLRNSDQYRQLRIKGSINLPLRSQTTDGLPLVKLTLSQFEALKSYSKGKIVVLAGDEVPKAISLGNILVKKGIPRVCGLEGGIEAMGSDFSELLVEDQEKQSIFSKFKLY